ncbi:MAG: imidazole glycerol phosphate synthase cyclase subunit [Candidatus Omnitrophota bacterium]
MKYTRIIPRLDIKGPNLVKGIHLEGLRVLGKPEKFARYYYENGADELLYMDVVASLYNRNSIHAIIEKTARDIFIPLTVGGGLRTLDDIRDVLRVGADKVALNTAALKNPKIISEASRRFGSSTIVVAIEAIKQPDGSYLAYTDNGREYTGVEVLGWAKQAEQLGAGEIMLTSVDREGTGRGFDIELTRMVADAVLIPVIAHGGAGRTEHICEVLSKTGASAVAISSILHYDFIKRFEVESADYEEGNLDFIKSGNVSKMIQPAGLAEIKDSLTLNNLNCRQVLL